MTLPHWPALLRQKDAAAYCSMSVPQFEREIAENRLPMPVKTGAGERWCKVKLDAAILKMADGADDWRARCGIAA